MRKAAIIPVGALCERRVARMLAIELEDRGFSVTDRIENGLTAAVFIAREADSELAERFSAIDYTLPCFLCLYNTDGAPSSNAVIISRPIDPARLCEEIIRIWERGAERDMEFQSDHIVYRGERINMSKTELALLSLLQENKGKLVSRETAYERIFGGQGVKNSVDVYIRYLRKKLDEHFDERIILTVRDKGYMLK